MTPKYSTPLFMAAEHGHAAVVEVLLRGGADPECWNPAGESPIYLAVQNGHAEAVAALLAGGTHPDTTTPEGLTLLQLAAKCGQVRGVWCVCGVCVCAISAGHVFVVGGFSLGRRPFSPA